MKSRSHDGLAAKDLLAAIKRFSLQWLIQIITINPVDKTELCFNTHHRLSTAVCLETYPLYSFKMRLR